MAAVAECLTRVLENTPDVRLAVLFGSAARQTDGPDSDIDVGVLFAGPADAGSRLAVALERAVGRPIDLIWLDWAPPLLRFEIARDGIVLVDPDRHAWATFRARAMLDWWDWAPTARLMHESMAARLKEEAARGPA
jgi:predicted nucleotidyltransferase